MEQIMQSQRTRIPKEDRVYDVPVYGQKPTNQHPQNEQV